ncbi:MAG: hypothetical protein IJU48_08925 [Synergistaceae bacterium]|nr:hypothetical protein [Synergistaceae bacterium]
MYEPVKIITDTLLHAKVGEEYSATIEASGTFAGDGTTGMLFLLKPAINVPSWLRYSYSGNILTLSGTPTEESSYSFTVDCGNIYCDDEKVFKLVVDPKTEPVTPPARSGTLTNGIVGKSYSKTLKASGGIAPYTWKKAAELYLLA